MKKLLGLVMVAVLALAACGTKAVEYKGEVAPNAKGDVYSVTFKKAGDKISDVVFTVIQGKNGLDKREDKDYVLAPSAKWSYAEQVEWIETFIEENGTFPEGEDVDQGKDDEGKSKGTKLIATDADAKCSIGMDGYKAAFDAAKEVK